MLIFRKGHTHIKQDDLSAYLDGQVSGTDAARIDQRLAQCADCREELDALRSTVSMLQRMPELTLPRSFVMPGPPPAPIAIRPAAPLRMPQWVYSGSAAVAALVLAVLISADVSGLLAPDLPVRTLESTAAAAPQAAPERLEADGAEAAVEMAAPLAPVAELAATADEGISVTATQESEVSDSAAKAAALPGAPGEEAAPQAAARLEPQDDSAAAAPVAAMAEPQAAEAAKAESALPPPAADLAYAEAEVVAETKATPPPAVSALTTPDEPSKPAQVVTERSGGIPPAQNPITLWRILEGLTAIVALTFLVMWLLRRRTKRSR
ncbi:MAG: hypothetical protein CMJ45_01635 [Planctomyces sp.]|nr:hypothetical protein [Planctomyces sp.]